MKKMFIAATLLIATSAQAENPSIDNAQICEGLKLGTEAKIAEILSDVSVTGVNRGINRLNQREEILTEFCGASDTEAHQKIAGAYTKLGATARSAQATK